MENQVCGEQACTGERCTLAAEHEGVHRVFEGAKLILSFGPIALFEVGLEAARAGVRGPSRQKK